MSFLTNLFSRGVLLPEELALVQGVFDRIASEPWVSKQPEAQVELAKYVIDAYEHGLCEPAKLYDFCLVAARQKFADAADNVTSVGEGPDQQSALSKISQGPPAPR